MFRCSACLWRCLRAVQPDVPSAYTQRLRRNVASTHLYTQQRLSFRTLARAAYPRAPMTRKEGFSDELENISGNRDSWKSSTHAKKLRDEMRKSVKGGGPRAPPNSEDKSLAGSRISKHDMNNRKRELQYLADPIVLVDFVRKQLKKGRETEMRDLVLLASKKMECIPAWNSLIDHNMTKGNIAQALKLYNDMKKRAQFPDSYTYTILLRGLAEHPYYTNAMGHAQSIYHSLFAPNSRVTPNIIHTNAMLKVCTRANDMDALWGVASKIPERGAAAANNLTYTTIINAIHQNTLVNRPVGETEEQWQARKERGVVEGRRLWEDIIGQWRSADLIVDEELVCAMGRLLLVGGRPRDWDDVLSLVEQTMNIPRLIPRLGTEARKQSGAPYLRAPNVPKHLREDEDPSKNSTRGEEFLPVVSKTVGGANRSLLYVKPRNNTLSLIQDACLKIVASKAAREYWNLLTDPTTYNVIPDLDNLHQRLRMLRFDRASAEALSILQSMKAAGVGPRPGTFRIAMSTCVRDKNNPNVIATATEMLNLMSAMREEADPKCVVLFVELLMTSPHSSKNGEVFSTALVHLGPIVQNLRLQLGVGTEKGYLVNEARQEAIVALRRVFGAYDKLIQDGLFKEVERRWWFERRSRLGAFLNRVGYRDGEREVEKGEGEGMVRRVAATGVGGEKFVERTREKWEKLEESGRGGLRGGGGGGGMRGGWRVGAGEKRGRREGRVVQAERG